MPKAKAKATPKAKKAGEKSRPQMLQAAEPDAFNVRFAFGLALARTDDPGFPVFLQPHHGDAYNQWYNTIQARQNSGIVLKQNRERFLSNVMSLEPYNTCSALFLDDQPVNQPPDISAMTSDAIWTNMAKGWIENMRKTVADFKKLIKERIKLLTSLNYNNYLKLKPKNKVMRPPIPMDMDKSIATSVAKYEAFMAKLRADMKKTLEQHSTTGLSVAEASKIKNKKVLDERRNKKLDEFRQTIEYQIYDEFKAKIPPQFNYPGPPDTNVIARDFSISYGDWVANILRFCEPPPCISCEKYIQRNQWVGHFIPAFQKASVKDFMECNVYKEYQAARSNPVPLLRPPEVPSLTEDEINSTNHPQKKRTYIKKLCAALNVHYMVQGKFQPKDILKLTGKSLKRKTIVKMLNKTISGQDESDVVKVYVGNEYENVDAAAVHSDEDVNDAPEVIDITDDTIAEEQPKADPVKEEVVPKEETPTGPVPTPDPVGVVVQTADNEHTRALIAGRTKKVNDFKATDPYICYGLVKSNVPIDKRPATPTEDKMKLTAKVWGQHFQRWKQAIHAFPTEQYMHEEARKALKQKQLEQPVSFVSPTSSSAAATSTCPKPSEPRPPTTTTSSQVDQAPQIVPAPVPPPAISNRPGNNNRDSSSYSGNWWENDGRVAEAVPEAELFSRARDTSRRQARVDGDRGRQRPSRTTSGSTTSRTTRSSRPRSRSRDRDRDRHDRQHRPSRERSSDVVKNESVNSEDRRREEEFKQSKIKDVNTFKMSDTYFNYRELLQRPDRTKRPFRVESPILDQHETELAWKRRFERWQREVKESMKLCDDIRERSRRRRPRSRSRSRSPPRRRRSRSRSRSPPADKRRIDHELVGAAPPPPMIRNHESPAKIPPLMPEQPSLRPTTRDKKVDFNQHKIDLNKIVNLRSHNDVISYVRDKAYYYALAIDSMYPKFRGTISDLIQESNRAKVVPCSEFNQANDKCGHPPIHVDNTFNTRIHSCILCFFSLGGMTNMHTLSKCPLMAMSLEVDSEFGN